MLKSDPDNKPQQVVLNAAYCTPNDFHSFGHRRTTSLAQNLFGFRRALNHTTNKVDWLPRAWVLITVISKAQRGVLARRVRSGVVVDEGSML